MLTEQNIAIIQSTVPVLEQHGEAITRRFYHRLFADHPELLNIFNQANQQRGGQQQALANAIYAAAKHIDQLENILPVVQKISQKHRALGVKAEHYPIVGQTLLAAMQDVLGDAATPAIIGAWAAAYGEIADVFIQVERDLYREAQEQVGGWDGYKSFVIADKVAESDVITSFYLRPEDGQPVASYRPGQYLTLLLDIPGQPNQQRRHYSLSDAPCEDYYRISVKREGAVGTRPEGVVSTYLHDSVEVGDILLASAPAGDFVLEESTAKPIVFLSGGVGMTPLISMLEKLLQGDSTSEIIYVHAAINGGVHAFDKRLRELASQHDDFTYHVIYERPDAMDRAHPHLLKTGYLDLPTLQTATQRESVFYFCGPTPFMASVHQTLGTWGVEAHNIHFEFFGPQAELVPVQA